MTAQPTFNRCTGLNPSNGAACFDGRIVFRPDPIPEGKTAPKWAAGTCPHCGSWTRKQDGTVKHPTRKTAAGIAILARYDGVCCVCKGPWYAGDWIAPRSERAWAHTVCPGALETESTLEDP